MFVVLCHHKKVSSSIVGVWNNGDDAIRNAKDFCDTSAAWDAVVVFDCASVDRTWEKQAGIPIWSLT